MCWDRSVRALVLGLLIASQTAGCGPSAVPVAAEAPRPTQARPTEGPIGTVVTPVSAVLLITPAPPPTGIVLVQITTATPGTPQPIATALPTRSPVAAATSTGGSPVAQQVPQQIASPGRITSVQLSSDRPVQLPCPDPRIVIGVPAVSPADEVTLNCQALDPSEVRPPPGPIVGGMVFRLFTDRAQEATLPTAASLGIAFGAAVLGSQPEADPVIGHLEGESWVAVPGQDIDQSSGYASAKIDVLGSYALYLQP